MDGNLPVPRNSRDLNGRPPMRRASSVSVARGYRRVVATSSGGQNAGISTRKLIIAALLCGLAILVAFAVQISLGPR